MASKQRNAEGKSRVHNPTFPLGLPGERVMNMSKTKNAKSAASTALVRQNKAEGAVENKKRGGNTRGGHRGRRNPLLSKLQIGQFGPIDLVAVGLGLLAVQLGAQILNVGQQGSWLRTGVKFGLAYGVNRLTPRAYKAAATAGAVAMPVYDSFNKLGVVSKVQSYLPTIPGLTPGMGSYVPMGSLRSVR